MQREGPRLSAAFGGFVLFILAVAVVSAWRERTHTWPEQMRWQVGQWVTYAVSDGRGARETVTYMVADRIDCEGGERFLLRITRDDGEHRSELEVLVPDGLGGSDAQVVAGTKMFLHFLQFCDRFGMREMERDLKNLSISEDRIRVSCGEFRCLCLSVRGKDGDEARVWISWDVPVLGLVRWQDSDGEMVLEALGKEGVSERESRVAGGTRL